MSCTFSLNLHLKARCSTSSNLHKHVAGTKDTEEALDALYQIVDQHQYRVATANEMEKERLDALKKQKNEFNQSD